MKRAGIVLAALALAGATWAAFAPALANGFVSWDDPDYVTANPHVRAGLTAAGVRWAFGMHATAGNWHPLTWLSHMLDATLHGDDPAGHHRTSVLLHAANAALALLALLALTRRFWPSFACAALFALHPLRAESVAWVSERKDVLSAFFGLCALVAYAGWARRGGAGRYAAVCLCLALGLLAKPMLVTLPCVLLLLDVWPLGRAGALAAGPGAVGPERRRSPRALALEKLPLVALALASAWLTVRAQAAVGAIQGVEKLSLSARLLHAPWAVLRYVALCVWPHDLACFYPHPAVVRPELLAPSSPLPWVALAVVLALCAAAWRARRALPSLPVGWLWFLGMLVPVLGLLQVGGQSIADRYTYLPSIGLSLAVVFPLARLARGPASRALLAAAACVALALLARATRAQCATWRSSETLFARALSVTRANYKAHNSYGVVLEQAGRVEEARAQYEAALAIRPEHPQALTNLGKYWFEHGQPARAEELFRRAVLAHPRLVSALGNLAVVLLSGGRLEEGVALLERALAIQEASPANHRNLGLALRSLGREEEAQAHLERAAALEAGKAEGR